MSHDPEQVPACLDLSGFDARRTSVLLEAAAAGLQGVAHVESAARALRRLRVALDCDAVALYDFPTKNSALALRDHASVLAGTAPLDPGDVQVRDTLAADGPHHEECRTGSGEQERTDLTVALFIGNKSYGVLAATSSAPGFTASDRRFMQRLAAVLALSRRAELREKVAQSMFSRSRGVFDHNPNPMMIVEAGTLRFLDVNQAAVDVYGFTREQWLTMTPYDLRAPHDIDELTASIRTVETSGSCTSNASHRKADGSPLDAVLTVVATERDEERIYIVSVQDMTERNAALTRSRLSEETLARAQQLLEYNASHDGLTGLPNRVLLHERLEGALKRAYDESSMAAVLFIDLDEFKNVNDTLGHSAGDTLLTTMAERLRANVRQVDCVARMGGDEFMVVLSDISVPEDVAEIARQLECVTAEPLRLAGREVVATCSIGIALFPQDGADAETLIRNADTAMYRAKRAGRATSRFFTPDMHDEAELRSCLETSFLAALHAKTFALAYQPIYDLSGTLKGSEALVRWPQADGSVIQPNQFIPFAEESGLIVPLGAWVLRTACMQNAAWSWAGRQLQISVNVSGRQLADPHFVRTVQAALRESGLAPALLELELTETVMNANVDRNAAVVKELRALGVRIAVDDFGTGYNSLATLRCYEVDTLKLDMCFVTDIVENPVDRAIASAVITAAHSLGAHVVAEGIETEAQLAALALLRCDRGQGYLFSKPLAARLFTQLLRSDRGLAA